MYSLKHGDDLNEVVIKLIEKVNTLEKEHKELTEFIKRNNNQTFGKFSDYRITFNGRVGDYFVLNSSTGFPVIDRQKNEIMYFDNINEAHKVAIDFGVINTMYKYLVVKVML